MTDTDCSARDDDAARWEAVLARDTACDGSFVYAVATTGVFCRPSCPARRPRRANVHFFATVMAAARAGYRPCKRCRPDAPPADTALIAAACRRIADADAEGSWRLADLARQAGVSPWHFHRLFKAKVGLTPRAYAQACRAGRLRDGLASATTVTEAIHGAGYGSSARFYAAAEGTLGMAPKTYRAGGRGLAMSYAVADCSLGKVLVAATARGVCAVLLGDDAAALTADLTRRFPAARMAPGERSFAALVAQTIACVESGRRADLPLDVQGTAFQHLVWTALAAIGPGETSTYAEIARRIGRPGAVRAVAGACAANPVAVVVPCHRVLRTGGGLGGYRWGVARKRKLLDRERKS